MSFDYPYTTHTDEPAIVDEAIKMANDRTLLSYRYERPDNGVKKAASILFRIYSDIIHGTGNRALARTTQNDADYYIIARAYVAFLGTVLIYVAWRIGRCFSDLTGIIAAIGTAIFPPFVIHSHYVTSDIAVTLAMGLCMISTIAYVNSSKRIRIIPMVFFAALGTLDKYPGILTCGMIALAVILSHKNDLKEIVIQGIMAFVLYVLIMFVISPNIFINWRDVYNRILVENRDTHLGADGLGWIGNMLYYCDIFMKKMGMNSISFWGSMAISTGMIVKNKDRKTIVFSVMLFWWVLLSSRALHWERWGMPMYFGWIIIIAYGIAACISCLIKRIDKRWALRGIQILFSVVCIMFVLLGPLTNTINDLTGFFTKKTHILSVEALDRYGVNRDNCAYDPRTPLYIRTNPDLNWTNMTIFEDHKLYRADSELLYILQNDAQEKRYKGDSEKYTDVIAKYEWLDENIEPIVEYLPKNDFIKSKRIPALTVLRKMVSALTGNYIAGDRVALFDAKKLPLLQSIHSSKFEKMNNAGDLIWKYEFGTLTPGVYHIEIIGERIGEYQIYLGGEEIKQKVGDLFEFCLSDEMIDPKLEIRLTESSVLGFDQVIVRQISVFE